MSRASLVCLGQSSWRHVSLLTVVNCSREQWRFPLPPLPQPDLGGGVESRGKPAQLTRKQVHGLLDAEERPCLRGRDSRYQWNGSASREKGSSPISLEHRGSWSTPAQWATLQGGEPRVVTGLFLRRVTPRTCVFWPSVSLTTRRCTMTQTPSSSTS